VKINIEVIPHKDQRCGITGEWWTDADGIFQVRVSRMGDKRYEALHIVHEIAEWAASLMHPDIMDDKITDAYDEDFLRKRENGELPVKLEEPGFGPGCPYGDGHHIGTGFEMILCPIMGVNWTNYEARVDEVAFEGKEFED
jgi:hypothetical protein